MPVVRANRKVKAGKHAILDVFPGLDKSVAFRAIFPDGLREEVLRDCRIDVVPEDMYMYIDDEAGNVVAGLGYLKTGGEKIVYVDVLHELTHIRQWHAGKELWDQEVFGRCTTVVQQAGVAGPTRDRGDEFPAPPDRSVHVRGVVSRGGPVGRPGRLAPSGRRGGTRCSDRLRAGRSSSSGPAESSSTAMPSSSRKPRVATARPWRSPGDILNSERPSRPASPASSSRNVD